MKNALLIIDPQYEFCNPEGALYVAGAEQDMKNLHDFIIKNSDKLAHICVTIDSHPVNDISHPSFWEDKDGNFPAPFTQINLSEVKSGKWTARFEPKTAIDYLEKLEAQGEFPHFIWTEHCLAGSRGGSIDDNLLPALKNWSRKEGKDYQTVPKGMYPFSEHFGIFMAQIPSDSVPETQINQELLDSLNQYDNLYLAGEAKSHCVGTSLKQIMDYAPELAKKVIVLEDCMSDIPTMEHLGAPIYEEARQKGIRFVNASEEMM